MNGTREVLGCVADDFTGASDAASFLQKAGLRTILLNGVPEENIDITTYDAIVIALKTRTETVEQAVSDTLMAIKWLEQMKPTRYYLKYCSTFDSTPEGNIGPIVDAVLQYLDEPYTLLCPALPVNGRTVSNGHLYVNGEPLNESPMKNHPLTPMWDSRIKNLMEAQSKYKCIEINSEQLKQENLDVEIRNAIMKAEHFYIVPDYQDEEDAKNIVRIFGHLKVMSGGSGILQYLVEKETKGIVLAGSCSKATLDQIDLYKKSGHPFYQINPICLLNGEITKEDVLTFIESHPKDYVLVYSSDSAKNVKEVQKLGKEKIAVLLEATISDIAAELVDKGYQHIIVAGGETSGAVTKKLGYHAFKVGRSVVPGVPVMTPVEDKNIRLILKSGNFGQPDFFELAIKIAKGEQ